METVPNREKSSLVGKGALLVSVPRNRRLCLRKLCPDGSLGHRAMVLEVAPPSNVTVRVKSSLIREGALLPPVVRRCLGGVKPLGGNEVIQRQRTGRVAQVEAVLLEKEAR